MDGISRKKDRITFNLKCKEQVIENFKSNEYVLAATLLEESLNNNGSIDSWLNNIPYNTLKKYCENIYVDIIFLDSKDLTKNQKHDLLLSVIILATLNDNKKGIHVDDVDIAVKKLALRMEPFLINQQIKDKANVSAQLITMIPDKKNPWNLSKGKIKLNKEITIKEV